jgi:hypothetical protein
MLYNLLTVFSLSGVQVHKAKGLVSVPGEVPAQSRPSVNIFKILIYNILEENPTESHLNFCFTT